MTNEGDLRTRYHDLPAWGARAVLAIAVAFMVASIIPTTVKPRFPPGGLMPAYADWRLYQDVTARVQRGENYYAASAFEQRAHNYPTRPWVAFREPTEVWFLSALRLEPLRSAAMVGLVAAAILMLRSAMDQTCLTDRGKMIGVALMATGIAIGGAPGAPYFHEVWAAGLIAASLGSYRPGRYLTSIVLGILACLVRETAAPYVLVMLAFAIGQRRWPEVRAWIGGLALFAAFIAYHMVMASREYALGDVISPGWVRFGGWPFLILTARLNLALYHAPLWAVGAAICLCVLGLLAARDEWSSRVAATVCVFLFIFACVGRPDNDYWGILYSPLLPYGLVYLWPALRDLSIRAIDSPRVSSLPGTH